MLASCAVVALAGYGAWRLVASSWQKDGGLMPHGGIAQVPAGAAPPPTEQSAAPLPPPAALPGVVAAAPGTEPGAVPDAAAASGTGIASTVPEAGAAATEEDGADHLPTAIEPASKTGSSARAGAAGSAASGSTHPALHARAPRLRSPPARSETGRAAGAPSGAPAAGDAPVQRMATAAPPAAPVVNDRWTQMNADLSRCTREDFINRVICDQRVRFRYCDGYWGKVEQCPVSPSTEAVR